MENNRRVWDLFAGVILIIITSYMIIDLPLARFCYTLSQETRDIFEWVSKAGESTYYLIVSSSLFIFFYWIRKNHRYANLSLLFFSNIVLSGIITNIIKVLVGRLRPKMFFDQGLYGFDPFHVGYEFNSLPSGHATTAFAIATTFSIFLPKHRTFFFILALFIAMSRLILISHYLSDVIAGAYIGTITAILMKRFIHIQSRSIQTYRNESDRKSR